LNKEVWKQGIKGVPYRLRVRISRKRNDEEGAKHRLFSYVQAVNVKNPKGLHTTVVSSPHHPRPYPAIRDAWN
jgi:large subunit ribosomal protein L31e